MAGYHLNAFNCTQVILRLCCTIMSRANILSYACCSWATLTCSPCSWYLYKIDKNAEILLKFYTLLAKQHQHYLNNFQCQHYCVKMKNQARNLYLAAYKWKMQTFPTATATASHLWGHFTCKICVINPPQTSNSQGFRLSVVLGITIIQNLPVMHIWRIQG